MQHPPSTERVSVRVPFQGFYNTIHDVMFDMALEGINTNDASEEEEIICTSNVEWAQVRLVYAQAWIKGAFEDLDVDVRFVRIESPSDYATGNDILIASIPAEHLSTVHSAMTDAQREAWTKRVEEELTERPGFIPFSKYPKDAESWGPVDTWDDAQRDLFFKFLYEGEIDEDLHAERAAETLDEEIWKAVIVPNKVPGHLDNQTEETPYL